MSFMMQIDAARPGPLEQLVADYFYVQRQERCPSIEFCRRVLGVPEDDVVIARRLSVAVSTVRKWRELGRQASGGLQ